MIKISSFIDDLGITKADFSIAYEKAFSKKLSDKTYSLSEKNIELVKSFLPKSKSAKPKASTSKVLKGSDLLGGGGFFSGLGFTKKEEKVEKEIPKTKTKETQKTTKIIDDKPKTEKTEKKDDFLSQATDIAKQRGTFNAKVIRRDANSTFSNKPKQKKGKGNIFIGKGKYRPKESQKDDNIRESLAIKAGTKKQKESKTSKTLRKKTSITIGKTITVKELSEKMGVPMPDLMKVMLQNKILGGINTAIDFDTATLLAIEFNVEIKPEEEIIDVEKMLEGDLQAILDLDKESDNLKERAPIVTVMGHVDHGKTSLLDYLRKTNVASGEAGGITQSIGASMITYNKKDITFIDTPGHELFTSLRARGAKLTNIVVIVIAAEDGLKPQTIESINHAKESGVPIIIGITKIDKIEDSRQRTTSIEKIKTEIGNYGLIPEDWGGEVPVLGISSKTGEGIDNLLEHILLQTEILELKYNPTRKAVGVIVDAHKSAKQGITASMIVLTGTLKVGDIVVAHNTYGKVKRMLNFAKKNVKTISGGEPVLILGLNDVPEPGRIVEVVDKEKDAQAKISLIKDNIKTNKPQSAIQKFLEQKKDKEDAILKIILKSDGPSSLEALKQAVTQIPCPENVRIQVTHTGIGIVTDSDISLAQASDTIILGFNTSIPSSIQKKADQQKVTIKNYNIIYELVEYVEDLLEGMIEVELQEVVIGKLNVLGVFYKKEKMMVIGGKVSEGEIRNGAKFKIIRDEEEVGRGEITSLQKEQESVSKVPVGYECGMKVKINTRILEGDILDVFVME